MREWTDPRPSPDAREQLIFSFAREGERSVRPRASRGFREKARMAEPWRLVASNDTATVEECYLCGDRRMTRKNVKNVNIVDGLPYRLRMYQHCVAPHEMQAHLDGIVCITDVRYEQSREVKYMMPGVGTRQNSACTLYSLLSKRTGVKMQVRVRLMYQLCQIVSCLQRNM